MAHRSSGEGTVVKRSDGRWQASLQVNGTRKTKYGKTRLEAYHKLATLRQQAVQAGALPNSGTLTLDDLIAHWLEAVTPTLKPRTIADYQQHYNCYIRPTLGKLRLDKLTPDIIQQLYNTLQARGLKRVPLKVHMILHRALKMATLWGWLSQNPTDRVIPPQYQPERIEMWNAWQLNAFLSGIRGHWLEPIWTLAVVTGCRLGELTGLRWEDIDLIAGTINIQQTLQRMNGQWVFGTPKTKAGKRKLALPLEGVTALNHQQLQQTEWRTVSGDNWHNSNLVFTQWDGNPLHAATVSHGLHQVCRKLGLPPLTPHGLRHLHASLLLAEGLSLPQVSKQLGHANSQITMSVYAHALENGGNAVPEALSRVFNLQHHVP